MDAVSIGGGASSWRGWCHTERGGVAFMSTCRFRVKPSQSTSRAHRSHIKVVVRAIVPCVS
jgi:hypothetical protein